jgi:hypothetical protein
LTNKPTGTGGGGGSSSSSFISNTSNHTLGFIDSDTGSDGTYYPGLKLYNPSSPYNVPIKIISNHPGTPSIMIGNNNEDVVGGGSSIGIGNNVTSASNCIAIGNNSHSGSPGPGSMLSNSIAIGYGTYNNGSNEIAIGSGASTADSYAIAIGANALATTGAIALGPSTTASAAGSIVINTDAYSNLSSSAAGLYINPIRSSFSGQTSFGVLQYDASTKEVFYGSIASSPYTNQYLMVGYTTTAVETELFVGGIPDSRIPTTTGTNTYYTVDVVCTESNDGSNYAAFTLKSVVSNKANVVSDVGNVYEIVVTRSSPNITVDVRADDVNNSINLYVTGLSGVSLQWKAAVTTLEM